MCTCEMMSKFINANSILIIMFYQNLGQKAYVHKGV